MRRALDIVVVVLMLFTAVGKLLDLTATLEVLQTVWRVGPALAATAFGIVVAYQVLIVLMMIGGNRRAGLLTCLLFISLVSLSPAAQLLTGSEAGCGCGLTGTSGTSSQLLALYKNTVLSIWIVYDLNVFGRFTPQLFKVFS